MIHNKNRAREHPTNSLVSMTVFLKDSEERFTKQIQYPDQKYSIIAAQYSISGVINQLSKLKTFRRDT